MIITHMLDLRPNANYIASVLHKYGVQKVKASKNGFTALCPFHQETNPSFSMSATGLWMCWTCGVKGSLKQFIERMGGGKGDWQDSLRMLGVQLQASEYKIIQGSRRKNSTKELPYDFKPYKDIEAVPAAISRRLDWGTIQHYGLGSSNSGHNADRCVIPIRYRGAVVGYHSRALLQDMEPRYYNPYGFDIKDHVFNYDECKKGSEIIVVEGAFNAMSMWEKGYPGTIAMFGTKFTGDQIKKLLSLGSKSIVICFDRDKSKIKDGKEMGRAGQRAAKKLGELIHDVVPTFIMPLPTGFDPNDLSTLSLQKCYSKKVPYEKIFEART